MTDNRPTEPADRVGWTARSLVAGAALVQMAVLYLAAPTLLRALGIYHTAAGCSCGPGGTAVGWLAAGAAVLVPVLAATAMAARRRVQRRTAMGAGHASDLELSSPSPSK